MHNIVTKSINPLHLPDERSAMHKVLEGEMFGHKQSIKRAQSTKGLNTQPFSDEMRAIIVERRTRRIKELKAEALLLGIQLQD